MQRFAYSSLAAAGLLLLASSCKKDEPLTSVIPEITAVRVSATSVHALTDSIVFSIDYRDGDGDLGENNANVTNLWLVDQRMQVSQGFRVQQLAPDGAVISIQGTLNVVLPSTGLVGSSGAAETVTWDIFMKDRAGNESNHVMSPAVTVNP